MVAALLSAWCQKSALAVMSEVAMQSQHACAAAHAALIESKAVDACDRHTSGYEHQPGAAGVAAWIKGTNVRRLCKAWLGCQLKEL